MSFAAPVFAWAAAVAALAVVGLHLLAWRRPPETPLPTARFAPERPIRMVSRAIRPADLLLLAIRVALLLLVGVALASPRFEQRKTGNARVVVVDRSNRAAAGGVAVAAARELRPGDALVAFDSVAREIAPASADSVGAQSGTVPGALSAALIVAIRAAKRLERERETVEIVVVSPFIATAIDAATPSIRSQWGGPLRRVRVDVANDSIAASGKPQLRGDPSDGVLAALALNGAIPGGDRVHVVRGALSATDSAMARDGHTVVVWPTLDRSPWLRRERVDTSMAVAVSDGDRDTRDGPATVVATFERAMRLPDGRVIARWADGAAAATEITLGSGCMRAVAVDIPSAGDLALRPSFRRFARRMTEPCGGSSVVVASDSVLDRVLPTTVDRAVAASVAPANTPAASSRLMAWLLALALAVGMAEMLVRRRGDHASA
jgi:hypothetical protein